MNLNYRVHEGAHHLGCDASLWTLFFVPFKDKRKVSQGGKQMRLNGETKTLKDPVALSDFLTHFQIRESQWKEMEKSFLKGNMRM